MTFEDIYGASISVVYQTEIKRFFKEEFFHANPGEEVWLNPTTGKLVSKGHIWICRHGVIDNLTVEPKDGGQYEIAVRVPLFSDYITKDMYHGDDIYSGYHAIGYGESAILSGHNTFGH